MSGVWGQRCINSRTTGFKKEQTDARVRRRREGKMQETPQVVFGSRSPPTKTDLLRRSNKNPSSAIRSEAKEGEINQTLGQNHNRKQIFANNSLILTT